MIAAMLLGGCGGGSTGVYRLPCTNTPDVVPPDEVTGIGFSADDAVEAFGDTLTVDVVWKAGSTPPTDRFTLALGGLEGDVTYLDPQPTGAPGYSAAACGDQLQLTRTTTVTSDDGGVVGKGTIGFTLGSLDFDEADLQVRAEAILSDDRWTTVNTAVDDSLPPPDTIGVYLYHREGDLTATISAEGRQYSVPVWRCDSESECAIWSAP